MAKPIPDALGPQKALYPGRPLLRTSLILVLALGAVGLATGLYGLYRAYYGYTRFGPAAASNWSATWLAGSGSLLIMALVIFWLLWMLSTPKVGLHTHGLAIYRSLRQPLTVAWEDLQGIATQVTRWRKDEAVRPQDYQVTLLHNQGRVAKLHGTPFSRQNRGTMSFPDFLSRIKAAYYPRLLLHLRPAWARGDWLSFGILQASQTGIRYRQREIRIQTVQQVTIQNGYLVVRCLREPELRLPLARIYNYEVLLALLATPETDQSTAGI